MSEFYWKPIYGCPEASNARVRKIQFGEGYAQRSGDGINGINKSYRYIFRGFSEEIFAIQSFLESKAGVSSFTFTPDSQSQEGRYICSSWEKTPEGRGVSSISATFERVFEV